MFLDVDCNFAVFFFVAITNDGKCINCRLERVIRVKVDCCEYCGKVYTLFFSLSPSVCVCLLWHQARSLPIFIENQHANFPRLNTQRVLRQLICVCCCLLIYTKSIGLCFQVHIVLYYLSTFSTLHCQCCNANAK